MEFEYLEKVSEILDFYSQNQKVYFSKDSEYDICNFLDKYTENKSNKFNDFESRRKALCDTMNEIYNSFAQIRPNVEKIVKNLSDKEKINIKVNEDLPDIKSKPFTIINPKGKNKK